MKFACIGFCLLLIQLLSACSSDEGRYLITTLEKNEQVLLDTRTGKTWMYTVRDFLPPAWEPIGLIAVQKNTSEHGEMLQEVVYSPEQSFFDLLLSKITDEKRETRYTNPLIKDLKWLDTHDKISNYSCIIDNKKIIEAYQVLSKKNNASETFEKINLSIEKLKNGSPEQKKTAEEIITRTHQGTTNILFTIYDTVEKEYILKENNSSPIHDEQADKDNK